MSADRPRPGIRLTDAEREHAAARLVLAHGEGRISLAELDERLALVYRARVAGDLEPLLDDVPTDRERRLLSAPVGEVAELTSGPGGLVRDGRWVVPRRLLINQIGATSAESNLRGVSLDFRTAMVAHPQVDIELRTLGMTQLILPPTGSADLGGLRGYGRLRRTEVPVEPLPGGVHLVVRGVVVRKSMVRVAYRPRRWWSPPIG